MQLLTGISIKRYLPARGTAGLARSFVRGYRRVPAPPPKIIPSTFFTVTSLNCFLTTDRLPTTVSDCKWKFARGYGYKIGKLGSKTLKSGSTKIRSQTLYRGNVSQLEAWITLPGILILMNCANGSWKLRLPTSTIFGVTVGSAIANGLLLRP